MSRFLPNTWLDAVQLPLAMVQPHGGIYAETIAPDVRPLAFVILMVIAASVAIIKARWNSKYKTDAGLPQMLPASSRSAWALIVGTLVALSAWIWTSANGRYGLLALTLTPLAALAALRLISGSSRWLAAVLSTMLGVQVLFLLTTDVDFTWLRVTDEPWTQAYEDRLPAHVVAPWQTEADQSSVLVVTTIHQTAMSSLYRVFGPRAHYMALMYIDEHASDFPWQVAKARQLVQAADRIYWSGATPDGYSYQLGDRTVTYKSRMMLPGDLNPGDDEQDIQNPITEAQKIQLLRFGLMAEDGARCTLLPKRMGARLRICPLTKAPATVKTLNETLPQKPWQVLQTLAEKCPRIFGEQRQPVPDISGGVFTSSGDQKYYINVTKDLDIYIRRAQTEVNYHLILSSEKTKFLENYSCNSIIAPLGNQYSPP